jgi:hypothetical protein
MLWPHPRSTRAAGRYYPVRAIFEELAVYRVNVKATLLCPAHSDTSRTLQRATTRMATKRCRRPRNVICGNAAPVFIDLAVPA